MSKRSALSEAEREQRRVENRERLKAAAEQLLTSEGWQRGVKVPARGGLARLSLNNQLLVALACPDATFVAGFKAWLKLGYCPVKGTRAYTMSFEVDYDGRFSVIHRFVVRPPTHGSCR